jgi:flagellar basal body P-ring formation protein FlgA
MLRLGLGAVTVAAVSLFTALAAQANTTNMTAPTSDVLTPAQRQVASTYLQELAQQAVATTPGARRASATLGEPDSRLRLAPCRQVQAHLPPGSPSSGRIRLGLRCVEGEAAWNIHLPATIQVFGPSLVAVRPLAAGSSVNTADFKTAEVDLAADRSAPLADVAHLAGRELQRALGVGEGLRQHHLRARVWFNTGETVKVVARGAGFEVVSAGQALNPGVEGQAARVRTENGRIVSGIATAERVVELPL